MKKNHSRKPPKLDSSHRCNCYTDKHPFTLRPRKSNITAERLTLLPGFISKGAERQDKLSPLSLSENDNESVPVSPPKLRRSWRLSKKNQPDTASSYFNKLVTSRSIFREIKTKYARKLKGRSPESDDGGFERKLFKQLRNTTPKDINYYKKKIFNEIEFLNGVLTGQLGRNMSGNRKRVYCEEEKENYPMKISYVPPSSWVFQTPPNRKLHFGRGRVEDNGIKPAVIETRNDTKIVYEMNKKINVNLTGCGNRQEINIDKRYMVEASSSVDEGQDEDEDKCDTLQSDPFELENYFLSLTCRPKKVVSTLPRHTAVKRKRDIFETQPSCSASSPDFKPNVYDLNLNDSEESFTFKFTSNETFRGSTTGHLFDFEGKKKDTFNFHF